MFSEPALEIKKTTLQAGGPDTTSYDSLTKVSLNLLVKGYTKMSLIGRCTRGVFYQARSIACYLLFLPLESSFLTFSKCLQSVLGQQTSRIKQDGNHSVFLKSSGT